MLNPNQVTIMPNAPKLNTSNSPIYAPAPFPELPTQTTCTLANLNTISNAHSEHNIQVTHAAVAANISIRRAFVATARQNEKNNVKVQIRPSLAFSLFTKERAMIDIRGANDDKTVPSRSVTAPTWSSS